MFSMIEHINFFIRSLQYHGVDFYPQLISNKNEFLGYEILYTNYYFNLLFSKIEFEYGLYAKIFQMINEIQTFNGELFLMLLKSKK